MKTKTLFVLITCCLPLARAAAQVTDLKQVYDKGATQVVNRSAGSFSDNTKAGIRIGEASGEGLVLLKDKTFSTGTIEVDLKGQDVFQKSFLGIAFHVANDSTYDAVYFRPFNFRAADSVRRIHAVQYISHPQFPWQRLREERNAQYEKAVLPVPDPNDWFHARIEVGEQDVRVYVNNANTPSLQVQKLNGRTHGGLALWTGDGSGGSFANLVVKAIK